MIDNILIFSCFLKNANLSTNMCQNTNNPVIRFGDNQSLLTKNLLKLYTDSLGNHLTITNSFDNVRHTI